ncbi:hypothetical protein SAMN05216490_3240 [Mucilaginibacter mallensis]|uniref:RHS repeat-associated core domain-containing protein n=1 Tax=Mucilaginibacter mallensis TaxID=652787 RepID=A0A1H1ZSX3_MUCMA|nr:hypothetical protein [Mucilaginibacter mallensis]SDT36885.1 hypothetical protein SAMN05216490_3240 [Mucilaginibacter mallensis]
MTGKSRFLVFLFALLANSVYAQTSGPSAPDVQKFTPNSAKELVNLFTGDLNYNISLLELDGGYPINLSYSSAVSMTEEAGPVGFGWQLNIGRINRTVRGLPDDFDGDIVTKELYQPEELTIGIGIGLDAEFLGFPLRFGPSLSTGLNFSNLRGFDISNSVGFGISRTISGTKLSAGLSLGSGTQDGSSLTPDVGLSTNDFSLHLTGKLSQIEGLKYFSLNTSNKGYTPGGQLNFPLLMAKTPFTPDIDFPISTTSGNFHFRLGGEIWGMSLGGQVYGQFTKQSLQTHVKTPQAYGYLYLQDMPDRDAIMDIGTEKESPVYQEDPNLSITYLASDVYSASAQGLSGTYRPFRTDIPLAHNENQNGNDLGGSLGGEIHGGAYMHDGIDITANITHTYSGAWQDNWLSRLPLSTQVYFKNVSETTGFSNQAELNALGGTDPVKVNFSELAGRGPANATLYNLPSKLRQEPSNTSFQYLTAREAQDAAIPFQSYSGHGKKGTTKTTINRTDGPDGVRRPHHISVIRITKDDGTVYEFGIAAYNLSQQEVTFHIPDISADSLYNKIKTDVQAHAVSNDPGDEYHYFTKTTTPGYAYAYYLTAVYSPDYVDLTGDGPTSDDLGTYTKFNYTRNTEQFKWRTPNKGAVLSPGNLADKRDDLGSYVYGVKEIWTIHSIETKHYIVEFYSSPRADGNEVKDETGGINHAGNKMQKIDEIKLYTRDNFESDNPVPVKTIHFDYSYALCPFVPTNANKTVENSGKLTLSKLYFSYQKSARGKLSKYIFHYNNEKDPAYRYNEEAIDDWGAFKPLATDKHFNNVRYPFSEQDPIAANQNAQPWLLNQVSTPEGGMMNISYEAKDYAYVQDKRAMQMFKVIGLSTNTAVTLPVPQLLYMDKDHSCQYLIVDLGPHVDENSVKNFLPAPEKVYMNFILKIGSFDPNVDANQLEQVSGYFDVASITWLNIPGHPGYAALDLGTKDINPVSLALWQKMKKNLSAFLYPSPISLKAGLTANVFSATTRIPGILANYPGFITDFKSQMTNASRGNYLDPDFGSFVRLYSPHGRKFGGGSRVKRITIDDNWNKMTDQPGNNAVYGQEYSYDKEILIDGVTKKMISSGVACYEPVGNAENPFVVPTGGFNGANTLAEDIYYYKTEPFGESFFPSPGVGYSKVTVKDILDKDVIRHSTGSETFEFYTSKDFPTITSRTVKLDQNNRSINPFDYENLYTATQGFLVELNNMNGKLKAHKAFAQNDPKSPVSSVEYFYKTQNGRLDNTVTTIDPDSGTISQSQVGLAFDFNVSTTQTLSEVRSPNLQFNFDMIPALFGIPLPFATLLPSYSQSVTEFKGITATKVIYRSGIIDHVRSVSDGQETMSNNELYDAASGNVVVTSRPNEFNDSIYTTKLPAYWFNSGMGPTAQHATVQTGNTGVNQIDLTTFKGGDELVLHDRISRKAWVLEGLPGVKTIIDEQGNPISGNYQSVSLLSSGRKNMQAFSAGEIVTKDSPLKTTLLTFTNVINASYTTYNQKWQGYFGVHPTMSVNRCSCGVDINPLGDMTFGFDRAGNIISPANASLNGPTITIEDNCKITIQLDKALPFNPIELSAKLYLRNFKSTPDTCCVTTYTGKGTYELLVQINQSHSDTVKGEFLLNSECKPTRLCKDSIIADVKLLDCIPGGNVPVNPYVLGMLGNWRADATYTYNTERTYTSGTQTNQGFYNEFSLYSTPSGGFKFGTSAKKDNWTTKSYGVVYDPYGNLLESLDLIKNPSSELYGYNFSLPVATAENANYYEIAYDGFEDYDYLGNVKFPMAECALRPHFKFDSIKNGSHLTDSVSHTGHRSLVVVKNGPVNMVRDIYTDCGYPFTQNTANDSPYKLNTCDIILPFSPVAGTKYVLSMWLNQDRAPADVDKAVGYARLYFTDAAGAPVKDTIFRAKGAVIDDWQQLSESFIVPLNAKKITLELGTDNKNVCFDDIRIQPFSSSMKTYVYDPVQRRLAATLDDQNYATFYEYDEQGQLTRVKTETEDGILTLREIQSSKPKTAQLGLP